MTTPSGSVRQDQRSRPPSAHPGMAFMSLMRRVQLPVSSAYSVGQLDEADEALGAWLSIREPLGGHVDT